MRTAILVLPLVAAACSAPQRTVHTTHYPSGSPRWQTEMYSGVPDGPSITWHDNGEVASRGHYRAGKKHGTFRYWDPSGRLIRVEEFRRGALVSASEEPERIAAVAPPSSIEPMPTAEQRDRDRYTELQVGFGVGATNAAQTADSGVESAGSMGFMLLVRRHAQLVGASAKFSGEIFGPSHGYVGAMVGYAGSGRIAHLELLAEAGVHTITGLGNDLFAEPMGDSSAMLPYVGLRSRLVLDPGDPNGVVFELGAATRIDATRKDKTVVTETCFFGCSTERQEWQLGGSSAELTAGFSYQF
jgi:hypothetical protein